MTTSNNKTPAAPTATQNDAAIPPYFKAVSGSLGGIVEACCLQPIDVIKTRLQLDYQKAYTGIWQCGSTIIEREGVRALWKGLTPFATHLTLKYTLRMGSNAVFMSTLTDPETGKISAAGRLAAGFGAGVVEAIAIVTPFEVCFCKHVFCLLLATIQGRSRLSMITTEYFLASLLFGYTLILAQLLSD